MAKVIRSPAHEFDKTEWVGILRDEELTKPENLRILKAVYQSPGHGNKAGVISNILGINHHATVNRLVVQHAKRIAEKNKFYFKKREDGTSRYYTLFFIGESTKTGYLWTLLPELTEALKTMFGGGDVTYPDEVEDPQVFPEGAKKVVTVNSYERSPKARQDCVDYWGASCRVCGFNFSDAYGEIGDGYIHVHHLTPISEVKDGYKVNPIKDMQPVCPNCHAMLHAKTPPFSIEELREIMRKKKG